MLNFHDNSVIPYHWLYRANLKKCFSYQTRINMDTPYHAEIKRNHAFDVTNHGRDCRETSYVIIQQESALACHDKHYTTFHCKSNSPQ